MEINKKRVMIFAAGTGGHIYPGISIAKELIKNNIGILWIGTQNGMENNILLENNISIKHVNFSGVRGKGIFTLIKLPFKLMVSIVQALIIIKKYNPDLVLSMGDTLVFHAVLRHSF